MGRYTLLIVLGAILGGSYLSYSVLRTQTETGQRRADSQVATLARQLAESGQAIALTSVTQLDGFANGGLFVTDRPYNDGIIAFEDYAEQPLGDGGERIDITVSGAYGGATHRLASVYEFDPMVFPGPIWLDVPYAKASVDTAATVSGGRFGYEPQIDPRKNEDLDLKREYGLSFDAAKAALNAVGPDVPEWHRSGEDRTGDLGAGVTTADELYYAVTNAVDPATGDIVVSGPLMVSGSQTYGAPDAITHVKGDVRVTGTMTGEGALVVEGDLEVPGRMDWTGLVIVRSTKDHVTVDLSGAVTITGALVVSQEAYPSGGHVDLTVFRSPDGDWTPTWGRREGGPDALAPSSWPLSQPFRWFEHTHRFDLPEGLVPDRDARLQSEVRFVDEDLNDPQDSYTQLRDLLDHLGSTPVQIEFVNVSDAHGHAVYEMEVDGKGTAQRAVAQGFDGTVLEGARRHRSATFPARDLERLTVRPRSLRTLKKLWDGQGSCDGNEWPYCVGENRNRRGALTVRVRKASNGRALYEGAIYWHMQVGGEQAEYLAEREAWKAGVLSGSTPFGTDLRLGSDADITYALAPIAALADKVGFDGNQIIHVSTESDLIEAAEGRMAARSGTGGSTGGPTSGGTVGTTGVVPSGTSTTTGLISICYSGSEIQVSIAELTTYLALGATEGACN